MTAVGAPSAPLPAVATRGSVAADTLVAIATSVVIVALALLPLLTPWFMHPALDAARADAWLGMRSTTVHDLSDRTVTELLLGPGTFALAGPDGAAFYTSAEASHLRDARVLLWLLLGAAAVGVVAIAVRLARVPDRAPTWRAVGRGGLLVAGAVVVVGVVGLVAFEPLLELFHRVFFPGGNWAFDARTDRMVQLYPFAFWRVAAAALGLLALSLGVTAWVLARIALGRPPHAPARSGPGPSP